MNCSVAFSQAFLLHIILYIEVWKQHRNIFSTQLFLLLCRYAHPLFERECPVVIGGDYITTESGTGLVHTAPGHGQEDFATGKKYDLPLLSPVDDDGNFTEEAGDFKGLNVLGEGNAAIVEALDKVSHLLMEETYSKYSQSMVINYLCDKENAIVDSGKDNKFIGVHYLDMAGNINEHMKVRNRWFVTCKCLLNGHLSDCISRITIDDIGSCMDNLTPKAERNIRLRQHC